MTVNRNQTVTTGEQYIHGRPGNFWIGRGTWVQDRTGYHTIGVIREIGDVHESGTVIIQWYPGATEHVSVPLFLAKLRDGRYEIDGTNNDELGPFPGPELEEKRW